MFSSSHHFLAEFLEVGGALTVLEVIGLRGGREGDKAEALRLLACIADRGRQFKELLCESYGECASPFSLAPAEVTVQLQ